MNKDDEQFDSTSSTDDCYETLDEKSIYDSSFQDTEYFDITAGSQNRRFLGRNSKCAAILVAAEKFVQRVLSSAEPAFVVTERSGNKTLWPMSLSQNTDLLIQFSRIQLSRYELSEHLKLLRKWLFCLNSYVLLHPQSDSFRSGYKNGELINDVIEGIRRDGHSPEFKRLVKMRQDSAKRTYRSVIQYIDGLFVRCSRLLVLRFDLGYKELQPIAQVQEDLKHLFNNQRSNQLFDPLVGYIWRLEHGVDKGYHLHVIYFLNGRSSRKDADLAQEIGEYWATVVTKGRGLFFNCNRKKAEYWYCGIGMVDHRDSQMRDNLCRAVAYLTKKDEFLRIDSCHGRVFGKGELPEALEVRPGRPRQ